MSGPRVKNAAIRYGTAHRKIRDRLLAELAANQPQPCPQRWANGQVCGAPMFTWMRLDLGHDEAGNVIGLCHRFCNRNAAQEKQVLLEQAKRQPRPRQPPPQRPGSRPW